MQRNPEQYNFQRNFSILKITAAVAICIWLYSSFRDKKNGVSFTPNQNPATSSHSDSSSFNPKQTPAYHNSVEDNFNPKQEQAYKNKETQPKAEKPIFTNRDF